MSLILAIDPGPRESALVQFTCKAGASPIGSCILAADILPNDLLRDRLRTYRVDDGGVIVIEAMLQSRGMALQREHVTTIRYAAMFQEACEVNGRRVVLLERERIKIAICGTARSTDANIRAALIDRFGAPGTKHAPGLTYGLKSHLWAAFAVAVAFVDGAPVAYDSHQAAQERSA